MEKKNGGKNENRCSYRRHWSSGNRNNLTKRTTSCQNECRNKFRSRYSNNKSNALGNLPGRSHGRFEILGHGIIVWPLPMMEELWIGTTSPTTITWCERTGERNTVLHWSGIVLLGGRWSNLGSIIGTLSNQAICNTALNAKLNLSGGTMTGLWLFRGNPISNLGQTTKQYVDIVLFLGFPLHPFTMPITTPKYKQKKYEWK